MAENKVRETERESKRERERDGERERERERGGGCYQPQGEETEAVGV